MAGVVLFEQDVDHIATCWLRLYKSRSCCASSKAFNTACFKRKMDSRFDRSLGTRLLMLGRCLDNSLKGTAASARETMFAIEVASSYKSPRNPKPTMCGMVDDSCAGRHPCEKRNSKVCTLPRIVERH